MTHTKSIVGSSLNFCVKESVFLECSKMYFQDLDLEKFRPENFGQVLILS